VWELPGDARGGPEAAAAALAQAAAAAAAAGEPPLRCAVAGGDGTASWVLAALHSATWPAELPPPACAVLPQGTGNDLSRVCGWFDHPGALEALSPSGTPAALLALLRAVEAAPPAPLDWWRLEVTGTADADAGDAACSRSVLFTNYFSVGFDAGVALSFAAARRAAPSLFASRARNKAAYGMLGALDFARGACAELTQQLTLIADGVPVPLPPDAKGLLLLNIGCFMGGVRPWPDAAALPPSMPAAAAAAHDGALEVCAHYGALHLAAMNLGLTAAVPLAVAREVRIVTAAALPAQADGEAWAQAAAELRVERHGSVTVLLAPPLPAA
jgi:diacylglycerol kinase (ATP)